MRVTCRWCWCGFWTVRPRKPLDNALSHRYVSNKTNNRLCRDQVCWKRLDSYVKRHRISIGNCVRYAATDVCRQMRTKWWQTTRTMRTLNVCSAVTYSIRVAWKITCENHRFRWAVNCVRPKGGIRDRMLVAANRTARKSGKRAEVVPAWQMAAIRARFDCHTIVGVWMWN